MATPEKFTTTLTITLEHDAADLDAAWNRGEKWAEAMIDLLRLDPEVESASYVTDYAE